MIRRRLGALALLLAITGCSSRPPTTPSTAIYVRAQPTPEPQPPPTPTLVRPPESAPVVVTPPAAVPPPAKGPGPHAPAAKAPKASPAEVVQQANHRAAQAPDALDTQNAIVQYAYDPGSLYEIYAAPMRVTDIALEPGERILGAPASGDVVRWLLAIGKSMQGGLEQAHVYIKPTRPELETNLAINTDRRTYLLELRSFADTFMAAVTWRYPADELARLQAQAADVATAERVAAPVVSLDALNFHYWIQVIKGAPVWTPLQAFDDGKRTFVRFPPSMLVREAPALFVLRDRETQLVNYRVKGDTYVIDRLFEAAELRVGQQDQEIVRIVRGDAPPLAAPVRPIHGR